LNFIKSVARQILEGVCILHEKHELVHTDLKVIIKLLNVY